MAGAAKDDYLLRQVQLVIEAIANALTKASAGDLVRAKQDVAAASNQLLGGRAALLDRLDAATAAQLINDPDVIGGYAEVARAQAELAGLEGNAPRQEQLQRRSGVLRAQAESRRRS
jgi:hypothetical protein